ncbi:MAG: class I SAM-dependent methyltransferase [Blastocatellia bacterium]
MEIARTPGDPRWIQPPLPGDLSAVLDVGCGVGQTLITCELKPDAFVCGVDVDGESLAFGKGLAPRIHFVRAPGERLPFHDDSFGMAIARVSLPFMNLPVALQEIARVIKPGGHVWFTLHPFNMLRERVGAMVRSMNLNGLVFAIYILINGMWFHLTGRLFRYPLRRERIESFQTIGGMTRAMRRAGFEQVRIERGRFFVVTAIKRGRLPLTDSEEEKLCVASVA